MKPHVPHLVTEQSFNSQATWVFDVHIMAYVFDMLSIGLLYNQALADIQLHSAGMSVMYASC